MVSVFIVITAMLGFINVITSRYLNRSTDDILELLVEGVGKIPEIPLTPPEDKTDTENDNLSSDEDSSEDDETTDGETEEDEEGGSDQRPIIISPETPFDSRYFTVTFTPEGELVTSDMKSIAAIDEQTAIAYATEAYKRSSDEGQTDIYKYRTLVLPESKNVMYIFLDCRRETYYQEAFFLSSMIFGFIGIAVAFLIIFFASKRVIKPIAESYEKQKRFITNAGHEIKTPITIIDANTELIELEGGASEWTEGIKKQTGRLVALTERLVTLSRMQESGASDRHAQFAISVAVSETASQYYAIATAQGKSLSLDIEEGLTFIGNEAEICQLISTLLDNAMKYSKEKTEIKLSLKNVQRTVELKCENISSNPIKKGKQNIFFERFYRSDAARAGGMGGFGIGLSVAEAIVTAHKGKISAYSPDGESIVFSAIFNNR